MWQQTAAAAPTAEPDVSFTADPNGAAVGVVGNRTSCVEHNVQYYFNNWRRSRQLEVTQHVVYM